MKEIIIEEYTSYKEEEILPIYESVGWSNYVNDKEMLKSSYEHSLLSLVAKIENEIVGVIRVVGDGHSIVYIQDIIVSPKHQRLGIGSMLLNNVLEKYKDVYQKVLITDNTPKTVEFYKSAGFLFDQDVNIAAFIKMKNM